MKPGLIEIRENRLVVTCRPHVAIKLRRVFGGAQRAQAGMFSMSATAEHAYELEWFRERHPLDVAPDSAKAFKRLVATEKRRIRDVARFDRDGYTPPDDFDLALPAREYQRFAADMALTTRQLLLADAIGVGKTVSAIAMLVKSGSLPAVVVVQSHLPRQWEAEIARFAPQLATHRVREGTPYEFGKRGEMVLDPQTGKRRKVMFPAKPDVLIINYHKLHGWADALAEYTRSIVFDEVQELRKSDSDKYRAAKAIALACDLRIGLSATPVYNYGAEIFAIVNVLAPDLLGSWNEFYDEWCTGPITRGFDGKESANKVRVSDPKALGAYLRETGVMLRRTRKEVGQELPRMTVVRHVVETDGAKLDQVATDVRELAQRVLDRIGTPLERAHDARDVDYRMRLATGMAKAPAVADFVRLLVESGEQVVLFLWHHDVYRLIGSLFEAADVSYALYTGEQNEREKTESFRRFVNKEANVLMMSLRAGAGLDGLQAVCSVAVTGELDWSPKVHEQNGGRLDRFGQLNPVFAYFLVSEYGSDPVIEAVLGLKEAQARGINDPYSDDGDDAILMGSSEDHVRTLCEDVIRRTEHLPPASRPTSDDPPESEATRALPPVAETVHEVGHHDQEQSA